jgi:hypothetical protein
VPSNATGRPRVRLPRNLPDGEFVVRATEVGYFALTDKHRVRWRRLHGLVWPKVRLEPTDPPPLPSAEVDAMRVAVAIQLRHAAAEYVDAMARPRPMQLRPPPRR